jgi:hypothetical protein
VNLLSLVLVPVFDIGIMDDLPMSQLSSILETPPNPVHTSQRRLSLSVRGRKGSMHGCRSLCSLLIEATMPAIRGAVQPTVDGLLEFALANLHDSRYFFHLQPRTLQKLFVAFEAIRHRNQLALCFECIEILPRPWR